MNVYNLSDLGEIVNEMIAHMKQQIKNPALLNSRFVFDEVLYIDVSFHQLNLTRGSSYLPLPEWLARKEAIINPCNEDQECFKWAVIAASRWEEIDSHPEEYLNSPDSRLILIGLEQDSWIKKFELRITTKG